MTERNPKMTSEEKLTMAITPKVLEDFYNQKVAPFLNGSGAMHYSTEEKVVGTWIDSKPIYQKTINFGALPNTTTKNVAHGISNFKKIVNIISIVDWGSGGSSLSFAGSRDTTQGISLYVEGSNIVIVTETDRSSLTAYITLQYTKTTD